MIGHMKHLLFLATDAHNVLRNGQATGSARELDLVNAHRIGNRRSLRMRVDVIGVLNHQVAHACRFKRRKRLIDGNALAQLDIEDLTRRSNTDGQRRAECDLHMRRKALRDGERQSRTTNRALKSVGDLKMRQKRQTIAFDVRGTKHEATAGLFSIDVFLAHLLTSIRQAREEPRARFQPSCQGTRRTPSNARTNSRGW